MYFYLTDLSRFRHVAFRDKNKKLQQIFSTPLFIITCCDLAHEFIKGTNNTSNTGMDKEKQDAGTRLHKSSICHHR